jgi:ketosteroid isomerase-like protein
MRTRNVRWLLPLVLIAAISGCSQKAEKSESEEAHADPAAAMAAADSLNKVYLVAVAARDSNTILAMYAPDAYLMPQGMPTMNGLDAIHTGWTGFLATPGLDLKFESTKKMVSEAGDMVVDVGTYVQKMQDAKGKTVEDKGKYVTVFKKTDAGWKIVVDTFNSDKGGM